MKKTAIILFVLAALFLVGAIVFLIANNIALFIVGLVIAVVLGILGYLQCKKHAAQAAQTPVADKAAKTAEAVETAGAAKAAEVTETAEEPKAELPGTHVYIDETGKKYHANDKCSGMSDPIDILKSDAEAKGYTACKKCFPDN
jgi:predicted lipid-binding transport protein (Tim44 family)